jgi:hypothetical protein
MKRFADLSEKEILALAITSEEEQDSKIYRSFAEGLREQYPASAKIFDEMADEEVPPGVAFLRKDAIARYVLQRPLTLRESETI